MPNADRNMRKESTTNASLTPLPTLLSVVGEELHHLAAAVERLHSVVELPGLREALRDAKCHNVLQGIDHVTQNLAGLSHFLTTLASDVPDEWSLDTGAACDVVLIASLSERLRRPDAERPASHDNDECEFF
jgi:hypothetical protein